MFKFYHDFRNYYPFSFYNMKQNSFHNPFRRFVKVYEAKT